MICLITAVLDELELFVILYHHISMVFVIQFYYNSSFLLNDDLQIQNVIRVQ